MKNLRFDISPRRLSPLWLIVGALIGRAVGLFGGLNFAFWYFASPGSLIGWQVFGAFVCGLFCSFLMTSNASLHTKGALLGLGVGFAAAFYGGEMWAYMQPGRNPSGLQGMIAAEGIFLDWLVQHCAWLGLVVGWITGAVISRKHRALKTVETTVGG
jgi:hypothetical protein